MLSLPNRPARVLRAGLAALVLAAMSSVISQGTARAEVGLVFGTYSPDKPSAMVKQLRPTLDRIAHHMTEILDEEVTIRLQIVRGYKDGADLIIHGEVDFMRLGPASYVMAKEKNPGLTVLAMESRSGTNYFHGIICVRTDSAITSIEQLEGRSFAFGNERSTLGRYFAQLILMRNGIYAKDLSRYQYLGRHDKVGQAVGSGLYDAGALEETTFAKLVAKGVPIRALAKIRNATRPWVGRSGLDPRVEDALRKALLRMTDDEALTALRFDGFLPGSDAEYDATRIAIVENPRFFAQESASTR